MGPNDSLPSGIKYRRADHIGLVYKRRILGNCHETPHISRIANTAMQEEPKLCENPKMRKKKPAHAPEYAMLCREIKIRRERYAITESLPAA